LTAWIHDDGWTVQVQWPNASIPGPGPDHAGDEPVAVPMTGAAVRMTVAGGSAAHVRGVGADNGARRNYLVGNDRARWVTDVRSAAGARLESLLPGVDAVVRQQDGHFEYDLVYGPGTAVEEVVIRCAGADSLELEPDGSLSIRTAVGAFRQSPPRAWTEVDDRQVPVACAVQIVDSTAFRFVAPERGSMRQLGIDPGIVWASLVGTTAMEFSQGCRPGRDAAGNVYLGGLTTAVDFPTTPGAYQTTSGLPGAQKAFVSSFTAAGILRWSTYLGGATGHERVRSQFVEPSGVVTACGATSSSDFPTVNAFDSTYNGAGPLFWGDAWVARLDPAQSGAAQLVWSTYVGGNNDDRLNAVHIAANGVVTAGGWSYSGDIPGVVLGTAYQPALSGPQDGFVVRLQPALPPASQLQYFAFFGGSGRDAFGSTLVDPNGVITADGVTFSADLPTTPNAFAPSQSGPTDQFVARLDPSLPPAAQLLWSTYVGGPGDESIGSDMVMDAAGVVTCAAWTQGPCSSRGWTCCRRPHPASARRHWVAPAPRSRLSSHCRRSAMQRSASPASGRRRRRSVRSPGPASRCRRPWSSWASPSGSASGRRSRRR
jgi:hypothetical protein